MYGGDGLHDYTRRCRQYTSHVMAQVLVHASSHPKSHPCVRADRLFFPCFLTLFPSVCLSNLFFFCLNLDLYLFLFHVDFIGALRQLKEEKASFEASRPDFFFGLSRCGTGLCEL